jgi:hypothetical protein
MSKPGNFIARWSRRKRAAAEDVEAAKSSAAPDATAEGPHPSRHPRKESDVPSARSGAAQSAEAAFDLTKLPPIETITAESDIRAFLAPGVPPELTRAALRRAWAADPKIRDFVGLSENSWDFNAPGAMAGFGSLEMTDELRRQIARMVGRSLDVTDRSTQSAGEVQETSAPAETSTESAAARGELPGQEVQSNVGTARHGRVGEQDEQYNSEALPQRSKIDIASRNNPENSDNDQLIPKRPHGRALPK